MAERGWDEERVMTSEAVPIEAASHNVVPRIIGRDKKGKMFVAMPYFSGGDLSREIHYMDLESALKVGRDIAEALSYTHENGRNDSEENIWATKGRAHGDVKPTNILMKNGRAFLSDFGSSTCITVGGNGNKRGTHGDINYRAPESFGEDAKPSRKADIWSLGSILYETLAKKGLYDGLDNIHEMDLKKAQKIINRKIRKNIPRKARNLLRKLLNVDENERPRTGADARTLINKTIENLDTKKYILKEAKKWGLGLGLPAVLVGIATYGSITHEPTKLTIPKPSMTSGMLYQPGTEGENPIAFEVEKIDSLPMPRRLISMGSGFTRNAKQSTDNRVVAYLAKCYAQANIVSGNKGLPNKKQHEIYMAHTLVDDRMHNSRLGPVWPVWTKNIEVALTQSETNNGQVDLEDVMAISRLGVEKVSKAKRISGSLDYKDYRNARNHKGELTIDKNDREFIDQWLTYYHTDID